MGHIININPSLLDADRIVPSTNFPRFNSDHLSDGICCEGLQGHSLAFRSVHRDEVSAGGIDVLLRRGQKSCTLLSLGDDTEKDCSPQSTNIYFLLLPPPLLSSRYQIRTPLSLVQQWPFLIFLFLQASWLKQ